MNQFKAAVAPLATVGATPTHARRTAPFLQFAPLGWLADAARVEGSGFGLHVAVLLQFRRGLTKVNAVTVPSRLLRDFGVDRHAFYRALRALELAGLVVVVRRKGKKPLITIVEPNTRAEGTRHDAAE